MTLDEMKLAVCEKLPELLTPDHECDNQKGLAFWRKGTKAGMWINWPTEGLQVCHEAEKLLGDSHHHLCVLSQLCSPNYAIHATYEQRLEALCRVWWPERF